MGRKWPIGGSLAATAEEAERGGRALGQEKKMFVFFLGGGRAGAGQRGTNVMQR